MNFLRQGSHYITWGGLELHVQQAGPELTDIHPLAFRSQDLRLMSCVTMSVFGNFTF